MTRACELRRDIPLRRLQNHRDHAVLDTRPVLPTMGALSKPEAEARGIAAVSAELVADGLIVSGKDDTPRVDLWVHDSHGSRVPLQVMAASDTGFGIHVSYGQLSDVVIVYAWHVDSDAPIEFYAMRWPECLKIAENLGWTETNS